MGMNFGGHGWSPPNYCIKWDGWEFWKHWSVINGLSYDKIFYLGPVVLFWRKKR